MKTLYANVREVAAEFDAFVVDVWGVLHDGKAAYPGAVECLRELSRQGKTVLLLSNTPSRTEVLIDELAALGFERQLYTNALASGEVTRRLLLDQQPGTRYLYVGPEERRELLAGTALVPTRDIEQAGFVLVAGLNDGNHDLDRYDPLLADMLRRSLPLYCASPDKTITTQQGEVILCAGTLAARYEQRGGAVTWIGKPYPIIYDEALTHLRAHERGRIVAIGDGLETDIAGALGAGLPTLLLAGGIAVIGAGSADSDQLWSYCRRQGVVPNGILARFAWE